MIVHLYSTHLREPRAIAALRHILDGHACAQGLAHDLALGRARVEMCDPDDLDVLRARLQHVGIAASTRIEIAADGPLPLALRPNGLAIELHTSQDQRLVA